MESEKASTLRDGLAVVWRHRLLLWACVTIVPILALVVSSRQADLYAAEAKVLLNRQNLATSLNNVADPTQTLQPDRSAETQVTLARVPEVAAATLATAGVKDLAPAAFLASSHVSAKNNADILQFSVTARDPALASRLATAYANQYIAFRRKLDTGSVTRARVDAQASLERMEETGQAGSSLYRSLQAKVEQLRTIEALQTSNSTLIQAAGVAEKTQPRPLRAFGIGLVLGVALGVALSFVREALDMRVHSSDEIASALDGPLLARTPTLPRTVGRPELAMLQDPGGRFAEPYRLLRTNLEFVTLDSPAKTIVVGSATPGAGKTVTASNLAVSLALGGKHVVLVDLDLRRPRLHDVFDVAQQPGVTDIVLGHAEADDALASIDLEPPRSGPSERWLPGDTDVEAGSLRLLTAGSRPPNPGDLISSRALRSLLAGLADEHDVVLLDAPPLVGLGDTVALAQFVDAIILVARAQETTRHSLQELRRALRSSSARVLGVVVNGASPHPAYGMADAYSYARTERPAGRTKIFRHRRTSGAATATQDDGHTEP